MSSIRKPVPLLGLAFTAGLVLAAAVIFVRVAAAGDPPVIPSTPAPQPVRETPIVSQLSAFRATEANIDVPQFVAEFASTVTRDRPRLPAPLRAQLPGPPQLARTRVLMSGVGTSKSAIYAFPTTRGRICATLGNLDGGCARALLKNGAITWSLISGAETETYVWGLAGDEVDRVDVRVAGNLYPAQMGRNAYFFEAAPGVTGDQVGELVVTLKDGSSLTVALSPN